MDFVTHYAWALCQPNPSQTRPFPIWPIWLPANLLSATAGGTLVLVYHMMHLPGVAQYVFDFRLCLKPTASSLLPSNALFCPVPPCPALACLRGCVDFMQRLKTLAKCFEVHFPNLFYQCERHFMRSGTQQASSYL